MSRVTANAFSGDWHTIKPRHVLSHNMENPRASVLAGNYMIDKITEGETIPSVPHRSDMWNVASKPRLNESCSSPTLLVCFTLDTLLHLRPASEPGLSNTNAPRLWNMSPIVLASRLWQRPLPTTLSSLSLSLSLSLSSLLRGMLSVVASEHPLGSPLYVVASFVFAEYLVYPMRLLQPL